MSETRIIMPVDEQRVREIIREEIAPIAAEMAALSEALNRLADATLKFVKLTSGSDGLRADDDSPIRVEVAPHE